ncbi:MAG: hypothetical protein ACRD33_11960, partial [Candidatus Acidiferrales bacterium]
MSSIHVRVLRRVLFAATALSLTIASGCSLGSRTGTGEASPSSGNISHPSDEFNPTGASVCLQQMVKDPAGPFHVSFTKKSSDRNASSVEADVTPASIEFTKHETTAGQTSTTTKHLAHSQVSEMDIDSLMGPVPWHGELVAAQDAARAAGVESVNGYNAMKYSIDTANEPAAQKATFLSLLAVKDYKIVGS